MTKRKLPIKYGGKEMSKSGPGCGGAYRYLILRRRRFAGAQKLHTARIYGT